jgi:lipopolysaccharide/colanic/teichoic acid biosynthesis glycosyltransferase
VASAMILVLMPLLLVLYVAVRATSPGGGIYRQQRVGLDGKTFDILKFRTMHNRCAEDVHRDYVSRMLAGEVEAEDGIFKLDRDDRVTAVGSLLRRTSLDELPQLWNVLKGEMSMVGPRPERPVFIEQLEQQVPFFKQRLYVKPGVTGHAQVRCRYGASAEDMLEKLQYDLYYIKNLSLFLDLLIVLNTVQVVLFARGR